MPSNVMLTMDKSLVWLINLTLKWLQIGLLVTKIDDTKQMRCNTLLQYCKTMQIHAVFADHTPLSSLFGEYRRQAGMLIGIGTGGPSLESPTSLQTTEKSPR